MADQQDIGDAGYDGTFEEDPAAEFLAREQDQLAALGDDDFNPASFSSTIPSADGFGGQSGPYGTTSFEGVPSFDPLDDQDGTDTVNEEQATNGPSDAYSAITQVDQQRQEPEKIKRWREEQAERLEKKDSEAEDRKQQWKEIAKKELEDWYKNRDEQLEKTNDRNRENENAFIQERDESIPGHEWERVCRLTDFNPKNSKNSKDVSRMRSILLQLKQTPLVR